MSCPLCPRHPNSSVIFYGTYGEDGHPRQRYRCVPADGSPPHTFTEKLPRQRTDGGTCYSCERHFGKHEGHQAARTYSFTVHDIALTLIDVGKGQSYRSAGRTIRTSTNRLKMTAKRNYLYVSDEANVVEDWVEVFAPLIHKEFEVQEWPETITLDHLPFHIRAREAGRPKKSGQLAFCVLGAVGYGPKGSFVVSLQAAPTPSAANWEAFLRSIPGKPKRIVCDEAQGVLRAIGKVWPISKPDPPVVALCEYHLAAQVAKILRDLELYTDEHPLKKALDEAFWDEAHWTDFVTLARAAKAPALDRWLNNHEARIVEQVKIRCAPYSIGALEEKLRTVKASLTLRRFSLKNKERLSRLLMLMRLHANKLDTERQYAQIIRESLLTNGGRSKARKKILDKKGCSSLRQR